MELVLVNYSKVYRGRDYWFRTDLNLIPGKNYYIKCRRWANFEKVKIVGVDLMELIKQDPYLQHRAIPEIVEAIPIEVDY